MPRLVEKRTRWSEMEKAILEEYLKEHLVHGYAIVDCATRAQGVLATRTVEAIRTQLKLMKSANANQSKR